MIAENNYTLSGSERILINAINDTLRNERNGITHNLYNVFSYEDALEFLEDGKNFESKLYAYQNVYIDEVNSLFEILESFFCLCEKI